ncbi:MAG: TlpA family protein disulfide reductase [Chitinophagaceae bacterium]|jgi:thiol-disulfide isomerase/thioredoxin|nr:TlpA family protein disulfide reductase [Chitinophagaceae bacterium]
MKKVGLLVGILCLVCVVIQAQVKNYVLNQFSFEDTSGHKYSLEQLKGKVVFVDCWFPACPPCRAEMPYSALLQQRLYAMKMDSNIVFVTISFKQTTADWKLALQQLPMPQAIHLYSPASTYEIALAGGNYPTYKIFNAAGILDIENTSYPSELGKIDFILFAATQNIDVTEAKRIFEEQGEKLLSGKIQKSKYGLLNIFFERFKPYQTDFKKALQQLQH